jgi:hypothetical protein
VGGHLQPERGVAGIGPGGHECHRAHPVTSTGIATCPLGLRTGGDPDGDALLVDGEDLVRPRGDRLTGQPGHHPITAR